MGKSFHHGKFISKLRQASKSHPRVTPIEATVNSLIHDPNNPDRVIGVTYTQKVSSSSSLASDSAVDLSSSSSSAAIVASAPCIKEMRAPLTIIADGCFSKFRKQVISKEVHVKSNFVG